MSFVEINSTEQLLRNLNLGAGYDGYLNLLQSTNLPKSEWERFTSWKNNRYTRNCISSCSDYELLLLCWKQGQQSPIHNFSYQESWIKVIEGELTIHAYDMDREKVCAEVRETIVIKAGETTYLSDDMGFHKVLNSSKGNTVSLHLNMEAVKEWEVFRKCRQSLIKVTPLIDTKSDDCE